MEYLEIFCNKFKFPEIMKEELIVTSAVQIPAANGQTSRQMVAIDK